MTMDQAVISLEVLKLRSLKSEGKTLSLNDWPDWPWQIETTFSFMEPRLDIQKPIIGTTSTSKIKIKSFGTQNYSS